jgi:exodeoxyribonuclease VII large subunit
MMSSSDLNRPSRRVLSVASLTALIKSTLQGDFGSVWVEGELSDVTRPQSGHVYFTLKDADAQIRAVMWRSTAEQLRFRLEDGMQVICGGGLDVYPPRGTYQLIVRKIEPQGVGALQLALQQLQQRLAAEGLFDRRHKKPLPRFPRQIALVTSPTGAAVRDFLEVLRDRWAGAHLLVIPTRVQGEGAAREIALAIAAAHRLRPRPDVLVVGRGGGSVEDLWCFNEEPVVRAIFAAEIPVISAVGHEIDVTLADLVADVRALTPTDAGQLVAPATDELQLVLRNLRKRLVNALRSRAVEARTRWQALANSRVFRRPLDAIHDRQRRIDELEIRSRRAIQWRLEAAREQLASSASRLEALSPLAVLARGYSLTESVNSGGLVRDANTLQVGDQIRSRFAVGQAISTVTQIETTPAPQAAAMQAEQNRAGG